MTKNLLNGIIIKILITLSCLYTTYAVADQVTIKLNEKIKAIADYYNPDSKKPAILILHGFLQTYQFSTVQYIASELIDNDYPVLTPNLSLNINKRNGSLSCEARHSHTSNDGNIEIEQWIQWLIKQDHSKIILIGHSTGSNQILSYANNNPHTSVLGLIVTSIGPVWSISHTKHALMDIASAKQQLKSDPDVILRYTIGFCDNNFTAPPNAFLSYMHWSEKFTLNAIKNSKKPVHIILGEKDQFLPLNWAAKVRTISSNLSIISNANHFFSGSSEFLLQDLVRDKINKLSK